MSIWPPVLRNSDVMGMRAIESLALDFFGIAADDPNPPECVMRWVTLSLLRLHGEGMPEACAKLDAGIAQAAAEFASIGRTRQ